MVRLTKIYTRGGDRGETSLGDGRRVSKDHPRVEAYGTVDELNALLGVARAQLSPSGDGAQAGRIDHQLAAIQNDLFDLGADLCVPGEAGQRLRLPATAPAGLEGWIDEWNATLPPLESFVLPAGSAAGAALHHARTVCRRAERRVQQLASASTAAEDAVNPQVLIYLNRLSDLLFVLARIANGADGEVLWKPGGAA
jgi:cob(I)alamin adenosyltransferase